MPFRERAKNLFKSRRDGSDSGRTPSDLYYTEENMPRPKYRAIPKKEHTDKLEAFSFGDAWRKRSFQSTHSPGGTRTSSRRGSRLFEARKSRDIVNKSRASSVTSSSATEQSGVKRKEDARLSIDSPLPEQEGDDSVSNVGVNKAAALRPKTAEAVQPNGEPNALHKTMSTAHDHQPFTEQDLALALQRSRLEVPAQ